MAGVKEGEGKYFDDYDCETSVAGSVPAADDTNVSAKVLWYRQKVLVYVIQMGGVMHYFQSGVALRQFSKISRSGVDVTSHVDISVDCLQEHQDRKSWQEYPQQLSCQTGT